MKKASEFRGFDLLCDEGGEALVRSLCDGSVWKARWKDGELEDLEARNGSERAELWIAPGLLDVQVNGYAGVDFQRSCTAEDLIEAAQGLRRDGCWRALLTLITCDWNELIDKVAKLRRLVRADPLLSRTFPGWHIEGPFLSDAPGFRGAHNPRWMRNPTREDIQRLRKVAVSDPVLLTLAPEREGALEAVDEAVKRGMVVSFGHCNASAERLRTGVEAGGKGYTHLGNGCPQTLDRYDNIVLRVIDTPGLIAGLIPDGHHLSPMLFRTLHRALGSSRIYWTTDAMAAAGAPPGAYSLGEIELFVGEDQIVRNPNTGSFAGSALSPIDGIRRGAEMLGCEWRSSWRFFSEHPAWLMNLRNDLTPRSAAGFCLLREH